MSSVKTMLPDVQNSKDRRGKAIQKVGITGYRIPFQVKDKNNQVQHTVGMVSMYTSLSEKTKGVNMSRYSQVIEKALRHNVMSTEFIKEVIKILKEKLESTDSYVKVKFPYFILKKAPVTDNYSHFWVDCILEGRSFDASHEALNIYLTVNVNYTSLCPCSKEMSQMKTQGATQEYVSRSGFGAHNQRSNCKLTIHLKDFVWIESLVDLIEECVSCPIYNTLKREDEKYVTERAYNNPRFVEDMAREIAIRMDTFKGTDGWIAAIEHYESIHQSDAVAVIRGGKHYIP